MSHNLLALSNSDYKYLNYIRQFSKSIRHVESKLLCIMQNIVAGAIFTSYESYASDTSMKAGNMF